MTSVFSVENRRKAGIFVAALMMGWAVGEVRAQSSAGACCLPNGACTVANDPFACQAQSGVFLGSSPTCAGVVCTGACCLPSKSCLQTGTASCTAAGGAYQGLGSACGDDCPSVMPMTFTYQGQLKRDGVPLTGVIDGRFSLWISESSEDLAHRVGLAQVNSIEVANGLFQAALNFGQNAFNGNARWLQIEVHDHDDSPGTFTLLFPRQTITPTPYSLQTRGIVVREDGNVGIGTKTPVVKLHVVGGTDTAPGGGGYIVAGSTTSLNISIDDNEIMARNNGQAATLTLNNDGGDVKFGGAIDIGIEDIQTPVFEDTSEASLQCPAGKRALSGGCWCGGLSIQESRYDGTGWYCRCDAQPSVGRVRVYVRCARVK